MCFKNIHMRLMIINVKGRTFRRQTSLEPLQKLRQETVRVIGFQSDENNFVNSSIREFAPQGEYLTVA
jgi:hypothetical protein